MPLITDLELLSLKEQLHSALGRWILSDPDSTAERQARATMRVALLALEARRAALAAPPSKSPITYVHRSVDCLIHGGNVPGRADKADQRAGFVCVACATC